MGLHFIISYYSVAIGHFLYTIKMTLHYVKMVCGGGDKTLLECP